jgi:hypothetical protein
MKIRVLVVIGYTLVMAICLLFMLQPTLRWRYQNGMWYARGKGKQREEAGGWWRVVEAGGGWWMVEDGGGGRREEN